MPKFEPFALGLDGEIIFLPQYSNGWSSLKIPKEHKTVENYEMFCYLQYCGMDAKAIFLEKINKKLDKN